MNLRLAPLICFCFAVACSNGGKTSVLRVEPEAAGTNCPAGGVLVTAWLDSDGDEKLGSDEMSTVTRRYVCNGVAGAPGDAGPSALTKVTMEAAGSNCAAGGSRIDTGLDLDGSGVLEMTEITSTQYVCNGASSTPTGIYYGDVHVYTPADLAVLNGIETLVGSLYLEGSTGQNVSFTVADLKVISGSFYCTNGNGGGKSHDHGGSSSLVGLTSITFPKLERVDAFEVRYQEDLTAVSAPALVRAHRINVSDNNLVTTVNFPKLTTVTDELELYQLAATSIALPELVSLGRLDISSNELLTTLSLPKLATVREDFYISYNDTLSQCVALRVLLQLKNDPSYIGTNGNDETTACMATDYCKSVTVAGLGGTTYFCVLQKNFADARTACGSLGTMGDLLWVTSAAELTALQTAVTTDVLRGPSWIGYTDAAMEGTWVATSGFTGYDPFAGGTFWDVSEPNGMAAENGCEIGPNGRANDLYVTDLRKFLCRVP